MTHGEDATMKQVEAALGEPAPDGAPAEAEVVELRPRHDPMLPPREGSDRPLSLAHPRWSVQFGTVLVLMCTDPGHRADADAETVPGGCPTQPKTTTASCRIRDP